MIGRLPDRSQCIRPIPDVPGTSHQHTRIDCRPLDVFMAQTVYGDHLPGDGLQRDIRILEGRSPFSTSCSPSLGLGLPQSSHSLRPHHIRPAHNGLQPIRRSFIKGVSLGGIMASACRADKGKMTVDRQKMLETTNHTNYPARPAAATKGVFSLWGLPAGWGQGIADHRQRLLSCW